MKNVESYYLRVLEQELSKRVERNPRYSLRAMAKALGLQPGALSQILSGKRIPSYKMAQKMLAGLDLTPDNESQFLGSLSRRHRSRGLERLNPIFRKIGPVAIPRDLNLDLFRIIGDWQHYAIMMLTAVEDFKNDTKWIASQLEISEIEAKLALKRLLDLELLKEENGRLVCWENHFTTADKHLTNAALKRHQNQILEKSMAALENKGIESRSHTSMTMAIDPSRIEDAKKLIEDFTNKMSELLETGKRKQVYEFHVGLFPIQKLRSEK